MDKTDESPPPLLRRRNSIGTSRPSYSASLPITTPPSLDLELISFKRSSSLITTTYTSLKDLPSPSAASAATTPISIRNRLVKQAAFAYLQPSALSSSRAASGPQFFRQIWLRLSTGLRFVTRVIGWIIRWIRVVPVMIR